MTWFYNEIVRSGNSQARIKNFNEETGFVVLYDIKGIIEAGMTIVGDESGTTLTLSSFSITEEDDLSFEPTYWQPFLDVAVYDGDGNLVAIDSHFTGLPSQNRQTKYMVVQN